MNLGILQKSFRESVAATLVCGLLACVVEAILSYVLPTFHAQFTESFTALPFLKNLIRAFVGAEAADQLGPQMFLSLPWAHPTLLAIVWAHAIIHCTRFPAGEIDRGTIDILLALPVSRREVMLCETTVWLASGAFMMLAVFVGSCIGAAITTQDAISVTQRGWVTLNLFCIYLSVGGFTWLISCASNRRGWAMTIVFVVVLLSFLLNYLAPFWDWANYFKFLSALSYYRPAAIIGDGGVPIMDMTVLLTTSILMWSCASEVFVRRTLTTV